MYEGRRIGRGALAIAALIGLSTAARPSIGQPEAPRGTPPETSAAVPASANPIEKGKITEALRKLSTSVQSWGGSVGVSVIDVGSGETVAALNEHQAFNPASNAKIATAAAALRLLGPQHRFFTGLYGKLSGEDLSELVLRGDGDPSLEARDLWAMASDLRALGVRRVRGIAVDQSYFDDRYVPPAFEQQPNEWAPFRAPVAPVSLNENTVLFMVRAVDEGHDAIIHVEPSGFVDVVGSVRTTKKGDPEKVTLSLEANGSRLRARLGGSLPEGSRLLRVAKRVDDPRLLAGYALRAALKQVGIEVSEELRLGGEKQKRLLVAHRSMPLGELLSALGKESDNFYAEMIFKAIGAKTKGKPASADSAALAVEGYLKGAGALEPGVVVKNGSGLFDANRISPWAETALLRAVYRDPAVNPDFIAQLSIGGVDGTLRGRFRAWAQRRAIRAKTGTLEAVATLSGYILAPPGRAPLAFSIMINGISGKVSAARKSLDKVVEACADELWRGAQ